MLQAAIVCPDEKLGDQLQAILLEVGGVDLVRRLDHYPNQTSLVRFMRASHPKLVFLSANATDRTAEVVAGIESFAAGTQIVAIHHNCDPQILLELMRAGVREFLAAPFERQKVSEALSRVSEKLEKRPSAAESSEMMLAFLPAKPGVGASTVALNTAMALARRPDMNVLLADFDLNAGMLGFMLKVSSEYCVLDALDNSTKMDEHLWHQLICTMNRLDVLQSGTLNLGRRVEFIEVHNLVEFARRNYKAICVDLSGNMERYSVDLMHEASKIMLVCTAEIPSLHLARKKMNFLRCVDLADRVEIVVNRVTERPPITAGEIEKLLGCEVVMTVPNDYQGVQRALIEGTCINPAGETGQSFENLAKSLLGKKELEPIAKRRFVEYFSLLPARYAVAPGAKRG